MHKREERIAKCNKCGADFVWIWRQTVTRFEIGEPKMCRPCNLQTKANQYAARARVLEQQAKSSAGARDRNVRRVKGKLDEVL